MRSSLDTRRGAALALVLWVLVLGATLLSIGAVIALQEQRAERAWRRGRHTFADADAGLGELMGRLSSADLAALARPLDSVSPAGTTATGHAWRGTVRRLGARTLLLEVAAGDTGGESTRLGRLAWLRPPPVHASAALSVGATARLGDDVIVSGRDSAGGAFGCAAGDSVTAGVAAGEVSTAGGTVLEGAPPVVLRSPEDSGLSGPDQAVFETLWARAGVRLSGGAMVAGPATIDTVCDQSVPTNWGDPTGVPGPCSDYRPVVAIDGDLTLAGAGQGILLVRGDLALRDGFRFQGILMVTGVLQVEATVGRVDVLGAVMAGAAGEDTRPVSLVTVRYSKCRIDNALLPASAILRLPSRGWKQLF